MTKFVVCSLHWIIDALSTTDTTPSSSNLAAIRDVGGCSKEGAIRSPLMSYKFLGAPKWYCFSDLQESVASDVNRTKNHPLVASHIAVHDFIYNIKNG